MGGTCFLDLPTRWRSCLPSVSPICHFLVIDRSSPLSMMGGVLQHERLYATSRERDTIERAS